MNGYAQIMKQAFCRKDWNVKNKDLDILIIAGKDDPVIQSVDKFDELVRFIKSIGYKNVESKLYEGMKHELLNETNNQIIYSDVLEYLR